MRSELFGGPADGAHFDTENVRPPELLFAVLLGDCRIHASMYKQSPYYATYRRDGWKRGDEKVRFVFAEHGLPHKTG